METMAPGGAGRIMVAPLDKGKDRVMFRVFVLHDRRPPPRPADLGTALQGPWPEQRVSIHNCQLVPAKVTMPAPSGSLLE